MGRKNNGTKTPQSKPKPRHLFEIKPKTPNQATYINSIYNNPLTICAGVAGTGKSLIAIAISLQLVQSPDTNYSKVIVLRPAIEACGESIGYLPGGLDDKMRPLIQPIVDNLRYLIPRDEGYISTLLEGSHIHPPLIEVIPMGYLRGRSLNNCVVILDEAQNASPQQFKLLLTRIGKGCKVIVEGDPTQSDKFSNRAHNGLSDAIRRLEGCSGVGISTLEARDIQRSKIIAPILERYEDVDGI